jgi:hypothetical protein
MSSFRLVISARRSLSALKLTLSTVATRVMSTQTIAVIDEVDLKDGQMYVSRHIALLV